MISNTHNARTKGEWSEWITIIERCRQQKRLLYTTEQTYKRFPNSHLALDTFPILYMCVIVHRLVFVFLYVYSMMYVPRLYMRFPRTPKVAQMSSITIIIIGYSFKSPTSRRLYTQIDAPSPRVGLNLLKSHLHHPCPDRLYTWSAIHACTWRPRKWL